MQKKIISVLLAILMIVAIAPVSAFAEDDILDYLEYEIVDGEVTITGCDKSISGDVVIPDTIEGYPVTVIGGEAFCGCNYIKNLIIPNPVKNIGNWAISSCVSLESVILPESLTNIDNSAFGYCYSLKSITIPNGVKVIPWSTFVGCFNLQEIHFPDNLEWIAGSFDLCTALKSVTIPAGTKKVEEYTFAWVPFMEEVYIYDSDVVLGERSFGYTEVEILTDYDTYKASVDLYVNHCVTNPIDDGKYDEYVGKYISFLDDVRKMDEFVIHGYYGSTAESYANEHGFKFVPICDHLNTEIINTATADCNNDGYTGDIYCNDCEEIIEYGETVTSAGHNYIENIIKEPTYSQDGLKNTVCDNCGDTTAEEVIPKLTIEDSESAENTDSDISIIYPEGAFDGEIEVKVTPVAEDDAFKLISNKQGNYKVTMFDINVTVDGQKVQPNGTVLVKIPLPKGYNQNKCVVYYVADDGTMEELKTYHYKDGYVYFETDHFSYYAVIEDVEESENAPDEELSFVEKLIAFFKMIIEFFKKIFGIA